MHEIEAGRIESFTQCLKLPSIPTLTRDMYSDVCQSSIMFINPIHFAPALTLVCMALTIILSFSLLWLPLLPGPSFISNNHRHENYRHHCRSLNVAWRSWICPSTIQSVFHNVVRKYAGRAKNYGRHSTLEQFHSRQDYWY